MPTPRDTVKPPTFRATDPGNTFAGTSATEHRLRLTNSEIVNENLEGFPQTLMDLQNSDDIPNNWNFRFLSLNPMKKLLRIPVAWDNSRDLSALGYFWQFHPALPDPDPKSDKNHNLYLCTVPPQTTLTSYKHWSLYTQGCFFHLRNKGSPKLEISDFQNVDELDRLLEQIRRDIIRHKFRTKINQHSSSTYATNNQQNNSNHKGSYVCLEAHHVGQTQYGIEQIKTLATWIINQMPEYKIFNQNCHKFVLSLMERITMTKRDGSIFAGTQAQIINWDLRLKPRGEQPRSQELGYLIAGPRSDISKSTSSLIQMISIPAYVREFQIQQMLGGVAILYYRGPEAPGACDPTGKRGLTSHLLVSIKRDMQETGKRFMIGIKDAMQELHAGNIQQVSEERVELRRHAYEYSLQKARNGGDRSGRELARHKKLLHISDEEAEEILQELESRELEESRRSTGLRNGK